MTANPLALIVVIALVPAFVVVAGDLALGGHLATAAIGAGAGAAISIGTALVQWRAVGRDTARVLGAALLAVLLRLAACIALVLAVGSAAIAIPAVLTLVLGVLGEAVLQARALSRTAMIEEEPVGV